MHTAASRAGEANWAWLASKPVRSWPRATFARYARRAVVTNDAWRRAVLADAKNRVVTRGTRHAGGPIFTWPRTRGAGRATHAVEADLARGAHGARQGPVGVAAALAKTTRVLLTASEHVDAPHRGNAEGHEGGASDLGKFHYDSCIRIAMLVKNERRTIVMITQNSRCVAFT